MAEAVDATLTLAEEDVYAEFCKREWCDGLPFVPPTAERVRAMLAGVRTKPAESLGVMPPLWRDCTLEKLAVNAVMAGCEPAYFPVVVGAVQCMLD
ncbi:MAG TPA: UGSC family (seleno)protein, partial [Methylomirabilota bacterium]|nr:UGSC family (seleno)protein [Methylomirabilota bacterium]